MIRPHRQCQCLVTLFFGHIGLVGHIGLWPYWYLAISVLGQMPNQMLDSRTKIELFGGCSLLWLQETFFTSPRWRRDWSLTAGKIFGFAGDRTVMIRYLWFDQWLAANRPMIIINAWVTSREDGLRQVAKSRAAFYKRSRCLWPERHWDQGTVFG